MKTTYKKEPGKSFLILEPGEMQTEFALQMLTENKIPGLLAFEKRSFNGDIQFFYDISGKHSAESTLELALMKEQDLRAFFQSLYCLLHNLHSYFLDAGGILLDFQYIYEDNDGYYFCYNPSAIEDGFDKRLIPFVEDMLAYIDHEDEKAVFIGYQFYRVVKEGDKDILQILEELLLKDNDEETTEERDDNETDNVCDMLNDSFYEDEITKESVLKRRTPDIFTLVCFGLLCLISCGFIVCLVYFMDINSLTELLSVQRGITAVIFFILSIFGMAVSFVNIDIKGKK